MTVLGTLRSVDPREIWPTEDRDFTPWLAREGNIDLLGKAVGLSLQMVSEERPVGPFRADILAKDADDRFVLIENQLERTDHSHLGQLMTYAAGLEAVTIIWIARRFTEEHRATLDWLNTITDEDFRFFGIEIELVRVDDSAPAAQFNIVSQPNDWSRSIGTAKRQMQDQNLTGVKHAQLRFWKRLNEALEPHPFLKMERPRPQTYVNIYIGRSGIRLKPRLIAADDQLAVDVHMDDGNAQVFFERLHERAHEIEDELGFVLDWEPLPTKRACRIRAQLDGAPLSAEERWPEYVGWMTTTIEALDGAFRRRIRSLEP